MGDRRVVQHAPVDQQPPVPLDGGQDAVDRGAERRDALVGRIFQAVLGSMDLFNIYLGDRLGLYRALADNGPATSSELATRAGIAACPWAISSPAAAW